jgi:GNAT superfamily N-acetyltransferase
MNYIQGPLGFTDMDKEGMLIDGFNNIPTIATWYNEPYYLQHLESLGYVKEADWIQNTFMVPDKVPDKARIFSDLVRKRYGLRTLQPHSAKEVAAYGQSIFEALNRSYKSLYGFTALSQKQIDVYIRQYLPMVNPNFICIILDKKDQVAGFAITMPSLSKALQKSGGKILPFGFIHLLKALKTYELVDMYLIGIIPEYQNKGLNAIIFDHLIQNFIKAGVKRVIANPQLEDNTKVISLFEEYSGEFYMKRRCFQKQL